MKPYVIFHIAIGFILGLIIIQCDSSYIYVIPIAWIVLLVLKRRSIIYSVAIGASVLLGVLRIPPRIIPTSDTLSGEAYILIDKSPYDIVRFNGQRFIIYDDKSPWLHGQTIHIVATFRHLPERSVPGIFDFNELLKAQGVIGQLLVIESKILTAPSWGSVMKHQLLAQSDQSIRPWIRWLVFGDTLEGQLSQMVQQFAIIDLLVVSGLHIEWLLDVLSTLLGERHSRLLSLVLILPLAQMMNWPISIIRTLGMIVLKMPLFKRWHNWNSYDALALIALVVLILDPFWLFNKGFQYSFFASFIIILSKRLTNNIPKVWRPLFFNFWMSTCLLPLAIDGRFHYSLWSPLLHWMMAPIALLLYMVALVTLLGAPLESLLSLLINSFESILNIFNKAPLSVLLGQPSLFWSIMWWLVCWIIVSMIHHRWKMHRRLSALGLVFLLVFQKYHYHGNSNLQIYFIDVDQGDSTLIITPYQSHALLIDTGGQLSYDVAEKRIIPLLNSKAIEKLDRVFITHLDFDHNGALASLTQQMRVDHVTYQSSRTTWNYGEVIITNYHPLAQQVEDDNESSMVLGIHYRMCDVLIMGDASVEVEESIIDKLPRSIDVLRIGHHGSRTSTGEQILRQTQPLYAVISVGQYNRYGHPHQEVTDRLSYFHIPYYETSKLGTISFQCGNHDLVLSSTVNLV